jgi:shikimate dehydrogenase
VRSPDGHTPVYALLGRPVRHSLSPALHNRWFEELDISGVYVALELPSEPTIDLAATIRELGLAGVNLTVPFKSLMLDQLDQSHSTVRATGATNVVVNRDGELIGYNTDSGGFAAALTARFGLAMTGKRCAVLGAGGAARAVVVAMLDARAATVQVLNRTATRAQRLASDLSRPAQPVRAQPLTADIFAHLAPSFDLVVNTTSGPAGPLVNTLNIALLPSHTIWVDLNYWQAEPPAILACHAHGLAIQTGLPMLVHQAALAFELFTGHRPDAATALHELTDRRANAR